MVDDVVTDDLHLNEHHAKLLARKITDRTKEACADKTGKEGDPEYEMTFDTEEEEIKIVMGRSRAMEIEKTINVKIRASRRDPNKTHIKGKKT